MYRSIQPILYRSIKPILYRHRAPAGKSTIPTYNDRDPVSPDIPREDPEQAAPDRQATDCGRSGDQRTLFILELVVSFGAPNATGVR